MQLKPATARQLAAVVSIVVLLVIASPLLRKPYDDSFPLSPYAMFATRRPTKLTMDYGIGLTKDGKRRYLSPHVVGSNEVLQALNIIARARQMKQLPQLCATLARRVAVAPRFADVVTVTIVSGTHDAVDYLVRGVQGTEVERARCDVNRGETP